MKKLIIAGAGGSGKDHFASFLEKLGYRKTKDFTSRPRRNEKDNDYVFVDVVPLDECYHSFKVNGRDWVYGYSKNEIIEKDFSIRPPSAILQTSDFLRGNGYEPYLLYFDIDETTRRERLYRRKDSDTERRLITDSIDFNDFEFIYEPDLIVDDPFFSCEVILEKLMNDKVINK